MMTSNRPRDVGGSFASRRGHTSQLSISDPSHHVTEAIGTLYGDEDDSGSEGGRPLSFIGGSPYQEHLPRPQQEDRLSPSYLSPDRLSPDPRKPLNRSLTEPLDAMMMNGEQGGVNISQMPGLGSRSNSFDQAPKSPHSPTLSLRDVQTDSSSFPLPTMEHPNDIAQELSNLQALRRLSMDVGNNKDPDMPPMALMAMPAIAPSGDDDENDPSRLLWVPARVHPELAPTEFKSFLEKRVHSIRRRSGDSFLSVDGDSTQSDPGSGGLRRKKSMLSRQIDNSGGRGAVGYVDGAEQLERRRSRGSYQSHELSLEELVKDPTKAVQKLTQDSQGSVGIEGSVDDMPILPVAPGMGLRRSTRTTYRKSGSIRSGERIPFSKRAANRHLESESAEPGSTSPLEAPLGHGLSRVQSEPLAENYSRPNRSVRRQNKFSQESLGGFDPFDGVSQESRDTETSQDQLPIRTSSTSSSVPIIETSTPEEPAGTDDDLLSRSFPQRSSSQAASEPEPAVEEPPPRSSRRTAASRQTVPQSSPQQYTSRSSYPQGQSLSDNLTANPSPLPGGGATRTDNLTFIPTITQEEKKSEKKSKKDRDDDSSSVPAKSSSSAWKWFKSGTDDKEKKKEENKKKTKSLVDKAQDNARLDVIQTSIDKNGTKGRESLILERENMDSKLQEERKKESHRKSDSKREKDGNIFSSIFGGSKKKEEKEKHSKKTQHLKVPEEPAYKPMVPDVDYHWTRFPLLEERAIYRMAHIKLANPRRSLLSQVLLSNFMYSYLAIVQAMHPQMNVPLSPQQKRLEEEARRKQQEQEYLAQQQMQEDQDSQDANGNYNFDYHRAAVQYAESGGNDEVDYVDDAQIYEDEHGNDHNNGYNYDGSDGYGQGSKEYYQYHDHDNGGDDRRRDGRDDMW